MVTTWDNTSNQTHTQTALDRIRKINPLQRCEENVQQNKTFRYTWASMDRRGTEYFE